MTKYREILRLKSLGFSDRNIARSCSVSRNTVRRVIDRAAELSMSIPGLVTPVSGPSETSIPGNRKP